MAKTPKEPCPHCDEAHARGSCSWPYRTRAEMTAARQVDYSARPDSTARMTEANAARDLARTLPSEPQPAQVDAQEAGPPLAELPAIPNTDPYAAQPDDGRMCDYPGCRYRGRHFLSNHEPSPTDAAHAPQPSQDAAILAAAPTVVDYSAPAPDGFTFEIPGVSRAALARRPKMTADQREQHARDLAADDQDQATYLEPDA